MRARACLYVKNRDKITKITAVFCKVSLRWIHSDRPDILMPPNQLLTFTEGLKSRRSAELSRRTRRLHSHTETDLPPHKSAA